MSPAPGLGAQHPGPAAGLRGAVQQGAEQGQAGTQQPGHISAVTSQYLLYLHNIYTYLG